MGQIGSSVPNIRRDRFFRSLPKTFSKILPLLRILLYSCSRTHSTYWRKLRTTNVIERCFVEVRRRTRPMVCFVNVQSVDRIIYAIFNGFNEQRPNRTLRIFTHVA